MTASFSSGSDPLTIRLSHAIRSVATGTQSYDEISCYGNSVERTDEIACRIYEFLPSRTTEFEDGSGPFDFS